MSVPERMLAGRGGLMAFTWDFKVVGLGFGFRVLGLKGLGLWCKPARTIA